MEELLTTKQVLDILQVDRTTIYRMLKDGRLSGVKVGQQWRFPRSEVEDLLYHNEAINECGVIGIIDKEGNENIKAYIQD